MTTSTLKKVSVRLNGPQTSIALEPEFWAVLERMATDQGMSRAGLLTKLDEQRGEYLMASFCRVSVLKWLEGNARPKSKRIGIQLEGRAG